MPEEFVESAAALEVLLPPIPDYIYELYKTMREVPRTGIANGILPSIRATLAAQAALEKALTDPADETFGAYQPQVKAFHDERIAPVAPYIEQLKQLFGIIRQITTGIDAGSIAAGGGSVFGTPEEELPHE